jgi:hypothetical protein
MKVKKTKIQDQQHAKFETKYELITQGKDKDKTQCKEKCTRQRPEKGQVKEQRHQTKTQDEDTKTQNEPNWTSASPSTSKSRYVAYGVMIKCNHWHTYN